MKLISLTQKELMECNGGIGTMSPIQIFSSPFKLWSEAKKFVQNFVAGFESGYERATE